MVLGKSTRVSVIAPPKDAHGEIVVDAGAGVVDAADGVDVDVVGAVVAVGGVGPALGVPPPHATRTDPVRTEMRSQRSLGNCMVHSF
jgi:hypothetical protein